MYIPLHWCLVSVSVHIMLPKPFYDGSSQLGAIVGGADQVGLSWLYADRLQPYLAKQKLEQASGH